MSDKETRKYLDRLLSQAKNANETGDEFVKRLLAESSGGLDTDMLKPADLMRNKKDLQEAIGHMLMQKYGVPSNDPKLLNKLMELENPAFKNIPAAIFDPDMVKQEDMFREINKNLLQSGEKGISRKQFQDYVGRGRYNPDQIKGMAGSARLNAPSYIAVKPSDIGNMSDLRRAGVLSHEMQHATDALNAPEFSPSKLDFTKDRIQDLQRRMESGYFPSSKDAMDDLFKGHHSTGKMFEAEKLASLYDEVPGVDKQTVKEQSKKFKELAKKLKMKTPIRGMGALGAVGAIPLLIGSDSAMASDDPQASIKRALEAKALAGDAIEGAKQGLTFGFADELGAGIQSGMDKVAGLFGAGVSETDRKLAEQGFTGDLDTSSTDVYNRAQRENIDQYNQAMERSPVATTLGEVGGGLLSIGGAAKTAAKQGLKTIAKQDGLKQAIKEGLKRTGKFGGSIAGAGGVYGAGASENKLIDSSNKEKGKFVRDVLDSATMGLTAKKSIDDMSLEELKEYEKELMNKK